MKAPRYLLLVLVLVAAAVAATWYLRNSLIQRFSAPLLAEYGFRISDISLDTLATRDAAIGRVELVHETGTTITVDDLRLPFRADTAGVRSYRAGKVTVVAVTADDDSAFETARWIERFLMLPHDLAGSDFAVDELRVASFPPVRDLHWVLATDTQALRASVGGIALSLAVAETGPANHDLFLSTDGQSVAAALSRDETGFLLGVSTVIDLPPWLPLMTRAGVLPDGVSLDSGAVSLSVEARVPFATDEAPALQGSILPTTPLELRYSGSGEPVSATVMVSDAPLDFVASIPGADWRIERRATRLSIDRGDWRGISLLLTDLDCRTGPVCDLVAALDTSAVALPGGHVERVEGSSRLNLVIDDAGTRVDIQPGATLRLSGLAIADVPADLINAELVSPALIEVTGGAWTVTADSVDAHVSNVRVRDGVSVTMPLFLERVSLQSADEMALRAGVFAPSSQIALSQTTISGPGMRGEIAFEDGELHVELLTVGLSGDGPVRLRHDLESGAGSLSVADARISFGARALDRHFSPWPYIWNIGAGTATIGFEATWRDGGDQLYGTGGIRVDEIAGFYNEIAFTGLSTELRAEYATEDGLKLAPADLRIALVDVGLPVENITAAYTLRPADAAIDIRDLRMEAFHGVVRADPFSFHTGEGSDHLVLRAERINLAELLAVQEFEAIYVAGTISAELPVTIEGDRVTVTGGSLTGEAPGGTIRYGAGGASAESASALDIATRALSNFEFDALSSSVDYGGDGDLKLQMRLSGRNPDMEGSRPVVLNLGVESNIPELLRSLQAARAVEEIIERRMAQ